jgi:MoaA/NifB/PqqE/SkfB family radical SAM enzyme
MNELFVPKLSFKPTLACNLRCKLCSTYSPYYTEPYHPPIEDLYRYADRLFEVVDRVGDFILGGGEPFLRKDLSAIIDYVVKYKNRFDRMDVITNGTIVPSDDVVRSLQFSGGGGSLRVIISDYGQELSVNVEKVADKISKVKKIA